MMMLLWWWMVGRDLERHGKMSRSEEFSKHLWWNGKSSSGTKNDSVRCLLSWNIIHKTEKRSEEEEEYSCENEAEKYDKALGGGEGGKSFNSRIFKIHSSLMLFFGSLTKNTHPTHCSASSSSTSTSASAAAVALSPQAHKSAFSAPRSCTFRE